MKPNIMITHNNIHSSTLRYSKKIIKPFYIILKLLFITKISLIQKVTQNKDKFRLV